MYVFFYLIMHFWAGVTYTLEDYSPENTVLTFNKAF